MISEPPKPTEPQTDSIEKPPLDIQEKPQDLNFQSGLLEWAAAIDANETPAKNNPTSYFEFGSHTKEAVPELDAWGAKIEDAVNTAPSGVYVFLEHAGMTTESYQNFSNALDKGLSMKQAMIIASKNKDFILLESSLEAYQRVDQGKFDTIWDNMDPFLRGEFDVLDKIRTKNPDGGRMKIIFEQNNIDELKRLYKSEERYLKAAIESLYNLKLLGEEGVIDFYTERIKAGSGRDFLREKALIRQMKKIKEKDPKGLIFGRFGSMHTPMYQQIENLVPDLQTQTIGEDQFTPSLLHQMERWDVLYRWGEAPELTPTQVTQAFVEEIFSYKFEVKKLEDKKHIQKFILQTVKSPDDVNALDVELSSLKGRPMRTDVFEVVYDFLIKHNPEAYEELVRNINL